MFFNKPLPIKLTLSFGLKACLAIFVHLYKIDILNIRAEKGSSLDSNLSTLIVASCVACLFSKINLSPHFQSLSNMMVYGLELLVTLYGTELTMYMIWIPLMKGLLWMSSNISKTFTRSRHKASVGDTSNCVESDLFCYINIFLALLIASNTLASFDCFKNFKSLLPSTSMSGKNAVADTANDVITKIKNNKTPTPVEATKIIKNTTPIPVKVLTTKIPKTTKLPDSVKADVYRVRPKKRPVMLLNVR